MELIKVKNDDGETTEVSCCQFGINENQQILIIGVHEGFDLTSVKIARDMPGINTDAMGRLLDQGTITEIMITNSLANEKWNFNEFPNPEIILITDNRKSMGASKFWEVLEELFNSGQLVDNKHFIISNDFLFIRSADLFDQYAEILLKRGDTNVPDQKTLYKYLENDKRGYLQREKRWFSEQRQQLWSHKFKYSEIGFKILVA